MILSICLILFLAAFLLMWKRKTQLAWITLAIAVFWFLFVGQGWLPRILISKLQTTPHLNHPTWKENNAIVVLGMGSIKWPDGTISMSSLGVSRILEAAELYYQCKKAQKICILIPSGGDPRKNGLSEAAIMKRDFQTVGIPESDILVEDKSQNTFQNAQFTKEILNKQSFDQIVLVTSGFHMRRSLLYFSHFQINPIPAPSDYANAIMAPIPLSFNFTFTDAALAEYVGYLMYYYYN